MHPSQLSAFRKTIIALLTVAFAGALLVFTAIANLNLLKSVYPDPQFYMFGLLALEGGVIYWTGYYLLHLSGTHKGLAIVALAVDSALSGVGFLFEMESVTGKIGTIVLPPVIVIVAFAVLFNVAMAIISHLIPSGAGSPSPQREIGPVRVAPQKALPAPSKQEVKEAQPGFFESVSSFFPARGRPKKLPPLQVREEKAEVETQTQNNIEETSNDYDEE